MYFVAGLSEGIFIFNVTHKDSSSIFVFLKADSCLFSWYDNV